MLSPMSCSASFAPTFFPSTVKASKMMVWSRIYVAALVVLHLAETSVSSSHLDGVGVEKRPCYVSEVQPDRPGVLGRRLGIQ